MTLTDVPAEYIENASDRHAIAEQGCRWSQEWADRVVRFANGVFVSQFVDGRFLLYPWQEHFLRKLYGYRRPDGRRRFRQFLVHCAKKNGKTTLLAVIALFELFGAGVHTPRVAVGSTCRENAEQVADELRQTLEASPLGRYTKQTKSKYRIDVPGIKGRFVSLSKSGRASQGLNLSAALIDEYHSHSDNSLYESLGLPQGSWSLG